MRQPFHNQPLRVLVVDDCPDTRQSLCVLLDLWGHEVRAAADGPAALAEASAFGPEVVLLDIGLPGLDGYEVARRLRRQPGTARALLVAVTGYGQEQDVARARQAGFDHHLVKPCEPGVLKGLLERWVRVPPRKIPPPAWNRRLGKSNARASLACIGSAGH
jgi:CheY-like chemotaxis protein